jgi:predicted dehydrogenase
MRVGLSGYGYWGAKHARVLAGLEGVELTVFEPDPKRRLVAQADHPGCAVLAHGPDRSQGLDAMIVATPPDSHHDVTIRSLTAGCHVLVEKPMALDVREAAAMVDAAFDARRALMVGHVYDYHPRFVELQRHITKVLGRVRQIRSVRTNLGMHRRDVDVVWDLAPHDIAMMNRIAGGPPTSVTAWSRDLAGRGVDDQAMLVLEYTPQDITAVLEVSWIHPRRVRELTVAGDGGSLVFDETDPDNPLRHYPAALDHREQAFDGLALPVSPPPSQSGRSPSARRSSISCDAPQRGPTPAATGWPGSMSSACWSPPPSRRTSVYR